MRKTLKRLMITVLTMAMMIGIFAVGVIQVKAAPTYELVAVGDDVTYEEAKALVEDNPSSQAANEWNSEFIPIIRELISEAGLSGRLIVFYNISTYDNINSIFMDENSEGWSVMSSDGQYNSMKSSGYVYYYLVINEDASQTPTPNSGSSTGGNTPQTPSSNPVKSDEPVHEHYYSWETVQEATTGQDGIEEYKCSCGAVAERNVIPAGIAMVKDLVRQIETAPENSTVEIKTEYFTCYTAYIMNELKKRPDISLKTTFKDYDKDGSIKTFTIPAGKAPDDKELFYGFTYLGNLYGWDE